MKLPKIVLTLLLSCAAVAAVGCAGSSAKPDEAPTAENKLPAYFEDIPADTFFFAGGSEPIPTKVVDSMLAKAGTLYNLDRQWTGSTSAEPVVDEIVDQMGGQFNAEGLKRLGIDPSPRVAFYSVGTIPVLRFDLSDKAKFLAAIDHLEAHRHDGATFAKKTFKGKSYQTMSVGPNESMLMDVADDTAKFAYIGTHSVVDVFLPYFVGIKHPKKSLADDNAVGRTVEKHAFKPYAAGYVDIQRMVSYLTQKTKPTGVTNQVLTNAHFVMEKGPACRKEYNRLADMAPKLVGGYRQFDATTTDFAIGAKLAPNIAHGLVGAVSGTPGHTTPYAEQSLLELGLGIEVGPMIDFLAKRGRAIQNNPFQCRDFRNLNGTASNVVASSGQIPPAVRKLAGVNLLLDRLMLEWRPDNTKNGKTVGIAKAVGLLRSDKPQALLYLVGQFVPQAAGLKVKPDNKPVEIAALANAYDGIVEPLLMMTKRGLALTIGPKMTANAQTLLDATTAASSPAAVGRVNLGKPARDLLANVTALIDKADADRQARGLTAQDIADARAGVDTLGALLPADTWSATLSAEVSDFGLFMSYRDQGQWDVDTDGLDADTVQSQLNAIGHVLGVDQPALDSVDTMSGAPPAAPAGGAQPTEAVTPKSDASGSDAGNPGTDTSGTDTSD